MFINVNGANIHYEEYGTGEQTVFMIHGNDGNYHCFDAQIPVLAEKFRVIAVDSRGHGESGRGTGKFTLRQIAADFIKLLDLLDAKRVTVVGFSDGGNLALMLALSGCTRIEKLVISGANLYPKGIVPQCYKPFVRQYYWNRIRALFDKSAIRKAEMLGIMVKEPCIDPKDLARLDMPVLVMAGEHDLIVPEHTELIYRSLSNAELMVVPRAGHDLYEKNADVVNPKLLQFI